MSATRLGLCGILEAVRENASWELGLYRKSLLSGKGFAEFLGLEQEKNCIDLIYEEKTRFFFDFAANFS